MRNNAFKLNKFIAYCYFQCKSLVQYVDWIILLCIVLLFGYSTIVLMSIATEDEGLLFRQFIRMSVSVIALVYCTHIKPETYLRATPFIYIIGFILLAMVLSFGVVGKGAQRWIDLGVFNFQPSEIMKIAVPMACAWALIKGTLPPSYKLLACACVLAFAPAIMIYFQPDLGTALLVAGAGAMVIFLSGLSKKILLFCAIALGSLLPVLWGFMHEYQKKRVLTLFDPWQDPLGAGYHTIQSIIAIGSGGMNGKGWNQGSQTQLQFLPERSTDFIFAVISEEFGFLGVFILLAIYFVLMLRCLQLSLLATDNFSRLVISSLSITFFFYVFVNIGMVSGFLPVVGVPLPLISYGGTSMLTLLVSFGIIMSLANHKKRRSK